MPWNPTFGRGKNEMLGRPQEEIEPEAAVVEAITWDRRQLAAAPAITHWLRDWLRRSETARRIEETIRERFLH